MIGNSFNKFSGDIAKAFNKTADRAVAFLYFREKKENIVGRTLEEIAHDFELAGLSKPRTTVLKEIFRKDTRVIKFGKDKRRLNNAKNDNISCQFDGYLNKRKKLAKKKANLPPLDLTSFFNVNFSLNSSFVSIERIEDFKKIENKSFDLTRLIKMCQELNDNFSRKNYVSVIILVRAILDHIPPIFGYRNFAEITNNAKLAKSTKASFVHLEKSSRNIADAYLHIQIRGKEILPTDKQVNFSSDIDTLLGEIIRILK
jgi:hypothetical protein